jgi:hypothetical protein
VVRPSQEKDITMATAMKNKNDLFMRKAQGPPSNSPCVGPHRPHATTQEC